MKNDNSSSSESSSSYEDEIEQLMDDENGDIKKDTESKRNKSKNKKKQKQLNIKPEFLEYFEAFKTRNEFIVSENPQIKGLDFTIESYSSLTENFEQNFPKEFVDSLNNLRSPVQTESINKINEINLYELIVDIIKIDSNVLLYGFGSKLKLIYDFINYFQTNVNDINENYHLLIFNCYNPEINLKTIVKEIMTYVIELVQGVVRMNTDLLNKLKQRTIEEQIQTIRSLIGQMYKKDYCPKFLMIMNNIDGVNFTNRLCQKYISSLTATGLINLVATCDNVNIPYLWSQEVKDNFGFYFLKFDTFEPYDVEISDLNGLTGNKGIKSGMGLTEIFKSFSKQQKELLKELAKLQIKEDYDKMTIKGIVDYLISTGTGICNNQNRFYDLILEAVDHGIVVNKPCNKNNKEIFKLDLDKEIVEKIANGGFDKD